MLEKDTVKTKGVAEKLPTHIAIVMDGNGRWAKQRHLPRIAGHRAGLESVKAVIKACNERGIKVLTLFAFSSENWQRPAQEVGQLLELFFTTLNSEVKKLHKNNVRLNIIGDRTRFSEKLCESITAAEQLTANNTGLRLIIAANYGGQWDILEGVKKVTAQVQQGVLTMQEITPDKFAANLCLHDVPAPDLFIRTSGEQRISNFLLWQLAYTELYFPETLWPDFTAESLDKALAFYASRQRRFGCTSEQMEDMQNA